MLSEDGTLLDGQHRLRAILISQSTIGMLVVRGADKESFVTMDSGKPRSLSDVLAIEGYEYSHNLAGIARASFAYISGASYMYIATKTQLEEFIRKHPYCVEVARAVKVKKTLCPKAPLGTVLFLGNDKRQLDKEAAEFLEGVLYGENLWKGDARHTLREWLAAQRIKTTFRATSETYFAAIARAWNAFAAGRELSMIKMIDKPTRISLPIIGFDPLLYGDVPDSAETQETTRQANLLKGKRTEFGARPTPPSC